jgi:hypothetical protein
MPELANQPLASWRSFYAIVGSAGAALIGVQFVVITLITALRRRTTAEMIGAFATPTVVHLGGALIVSALMSAPWRSLVPASVALSACGVVGLGYGAVVIRRARRQTGYNPGWEDWLWYATLPLCAYAALVVGALLLRTATSTAAVVIAGAALTLLFIGIHNAWDAVTHMVTTRADGDATNSGTQENGE